MSEAPASESPAGPSATPTGGREKQADKEEGVEKTNPLPKESAPTNQEPARPLAESEGQGAQVGRYNLRARLPKPSFGRSAL